MRNNQVYIIGGGLSGLSAAISLARGGNTDVTILEQGSDYSTRLRSANSDLLCGLGGAGTLGGGKLCFPPASGGIWAKTSNFRSEFQRFKRCYFSDRLSKAPTPLYPFICDGEGALTLKRYESEVLFQDSMHAWISGLIATAIATGVKIRCHCTYLSHKKEKQGFAVDFQNEDGCLERQTAAYLLFATGRSSASMLHSVFRPKAVPMPDLGLRMSLDRHQQYVFSAIGKDVKLKSTIGDFSVRTFCVCSGGDSVMVTKGQHRYYDGHFAKGDTGITNLGILARSKAYCGLSAADDYLSAMQAYITADMSLKDFLNYRKLLTRDNPYEPLFEAIAEFLRRLQAAGLLTQNPSTIPVMIPSVDRLNAKITTDCGFQTIQPGIYVIGDAAGISRGFVQAMWSGYCAAERIRQNTQFEQENRGVV